MNIADNSRCHLWTADKLSMDDLLNSLEDVRTYSDESHLIRKLKKCRLCGQLYFYEFSEEVDWSEGNDPQARKWIPLENENSAEQLNAMSSDQLDQFPRIFQEWTKEAKEPSQPQKIL